MGITLYFYFITNVYINLFFFLKKKGGGGGVDYYYYYYELIFFQNKKKRELKKRRTIISEEWIEQYLKGIQGQFLSRFDEDTQAVILYRWQIENEELITNQEIDANDLQIHAKSSEMSGRITGSVEWRQSRGELGNDKKEEKTQESEKLTVQQRVYREDLFGYMAKLETPRRVLFPLLRKDAKSEIFDSLDDWLCQGALQ
ncbi:hypothetical protein RFI_30066, partial [Reticulomyxa filosa]